MLKYLIIGGGGGGGGGQPEMTKKEDVNVTNVILLELPLSLLLFYKLITIPRKFREILKSIASFQKSGLNVEEYVNLVTQLQLDLGKVNLEAPDAATSYFFEEYVEAVNASVLVNPLEHSSRSRPTVGVAVVQRKQRALIRLRGVHVDFLKELRDQAQVYWFNHQYWTRDHANTDRLKILVASSTL